MYIDYSDINIHERSMALQIANPGVVAKVERLARERGVTKTALVEQAVDLLAQHNPGRKSDFARKLDALMAEADRIPIDPDAKDPIEWDEIGLPI